METGFNIDLQNHLLTIYQISFTNNKFDVMEMQQLYKFAELKGVATGYLNSILTNQVHEPAVPEATGKKIGYLYDFAVIIYKDSEFTSEEYNLFSKYCEILEFLPENIDAICNFLIACVEEEKELQEILDVLN